MADESDIPWGFAQRPKSMTLGTRLIRAAGVQATVIRLKQTKMDACYGVEREHDKLIKKCGVIRENTEKCLSELLRTFTAIQAELSKG